MKTSFAIQILPNMGTTEETIRVLMHLKVEQKVEREPAAKVTGTNRDDSVEKKPVVKKTQKILKWV